MEDQNWHRGSQRHTWLLTPLSRSKGQGHQATLLSAASTREAGPRWPCERIGRGKLLLCCVCLAAREALGRPRGRRGAGAYRVATRTACFLYVSCVVVVSCVWVFVFFFLIRVLIKINEKWNVGTKHTCTSQWKSHYFIQSSDYRENSAWQKRAHSTTQHRLQGVGTSSGTRQPTNLQRNYNHIT